MYLTLGLSGEGPRGGGSLAQDIGCVERSLTTYIG